MAREHVVRVSKAARRSISSAIYIALVFSLLVFTTNQLEAQVEQSSNQEESEPTSAAGLLSLTQLIEAKRNEYGSVQKQLLDPAKSTGREEELRRELQSLNREIDSLEDDFNEMVTSISDHQFYYTAESTDKTFFEEAQALLTPLLQEAKRLTSKPRHISNLRQEIDRQRQQIIWANQALTRIERTLTLPLTDEELNLELLQLKNSWESKLSTAEASLAVSEQQLRILTSEKKTLTERASELFDLFFKSRGRNLLLATFAALIVWLILRFAYRRFERRYQVSSRQKPIIRRLINVGYLLAQFVGVSLVFLATLSFLGDWILLILSITILLGIIWASKQAIPKMGTHLGLMLNMGNAREEERVIYNDVPFKVKSIGFQSYLTNPLLSPTLLRISINDLGELRSRSYNQSEPWFPTKKGDWIYTSDDKLAEVLSQSSELVQLRYKGGALCTIKTGEFLEMNFTNLSSGFRIHEVFGLDYELQDTVTHSVLERLAEGISHRLGKIHDNNLWKLKVEFHSAAESALNISLILDCDGTLATHYQVLCRALQAFAVEIATEHSWNIPFPQLTVSKRD